VRGRRGERGDRRQTRRGVGGAEVREDRRGGRRGAGVGQAWGMALHAGRLALTLSPRLEMTEMTVDRAGMLTPAARVSVAKTTLISALWNSPSISPFSKGNMPA
jgi:hypothetical protein